MLTAEKNARLTQVGPDTPGGQLLRRYWQALWPAADFTRENPRKRLTLLSEDLVVYKGEDGTFGCVAERCTHRGCSLYYGFIEGDAIRCPYHGWKFAPDGKVLEQPFEPAGSTYKDRVRQTAYPVQELGGMLFVYMGPLPAPLLPRWDVLVRNDGQRKWQMRPTLRCNWLQAQENTADTVHTYYLHGEMMLSKGLDNPGVRYFHRPIASYDYKLCEWGIEKRCFYDLGNGETEEEIRPPLIFPNILRIPVGISETQHFRTPVNDTSTRIFVAWFTPNETGKDEPAPLRVPFETLAEEVEENGDYALRNFDSHDRMAWETQGAIYDRTKEHLGVSDTGVIMLRNLLDEQIAVVEAGGEPMNVLRDPAKNTIIEFKSHTVRAFNAVI